MSARSFYCGHCDSRFTLNAEIESPRCPNCLKKTSIQSLATDEEKANNRQALLQNRNKAFYFLFFHSFVVVILAIIGPQTRPFVLGVLAWSFVGFLLLALFFYAKETKAKTGAINNPMKTTV